MVRVADALASLLVSEKPAVFFVEVARLGRLARERMAINRLVNQCNRCMYAGTVTYELTRDAAQHVMEKTMS